MKKHLLGGNEIEKTHAYKKKTFPFKYLECTIYYGKKTKVHYKDILREMTKMITGWQNECLFYGG